MYSLRIKRSLASFFLCLVLIALFLGSGLLKIDNDFTAFNVDKFYDVYDVSLPDDVTQKEWADSLAQYFRYDLVGITVIMFLWFVTAVVSNPEIKEMRRKWWIIFILCALSSAVISLTFLWFYSTEDNVINILIFIYLFIFPVVIFFITTLFCHNEIKYTNPVYKLFGK